MSKNREFDCHNLEDNLYIQQRQILMKYLNFFWRDLIKFNRYFAGENLPIFYSQNPNQLENLQIPDFFVVLETENKPRESWIVSKENGQYPNVIIELLSPETAEIDKGLKKQIYQDVFQTPEYFWFDPYTLEFAGFELTDGIYEPIPPNSQGLLWSPEISLYLGIHENKLRYFTAEETLIRTMEDFAEMERQEMKRMAERLEKLLNDPDTI